jgi:hypothetical protein
MSDESVDIDAVYDRPMLHIEVTSYHLRGNAGVVVTLWTEDPKNSFRRHTGAPTGRLSAAQAADLCLMIDKAVPDAIACRGGIQEVLPLA